MQYQLIANSEESVEIRSPDNVLEGSGLEVGRKRAANRRNEVASCEFGVLRGQQNLRHRDFPYDWPSLIEVTMREHGVSYGLEHHRTSTYGRIHYRPMQQGRPRAVQCLLSAYRRRSACMSTDTRSNVHHFRRLSSG